MGWIRRITAGVVGSATGNDRITGGHRFYLIIAEVANIAG